MSKNLTSEEKALLAAEEQGNGSIGARRGRKPAAAKEMAPAEVPVPQEDAPAEAPVQAAAPAEERPAEAAAPKEDAAVEATASTTPARGPLTPVQYGGDGWGDTPIQMRG